MKTKILATSGGALLATSIVLMGCSAPGATQVPPTVIPVTNSQPAPVTFTWTCLPNQQADTYTLTLRNASGRTVPLDTLQVGIYDVNGTQIGTLSVPNVTISPDTTYRLTAQLWTSTLAGQAYSCKVLESS